MSIVACSIGSRVVMIESSTVRTGGRWDRRSL
jgi:hypothetical protein